MRKLLILSIGLYFSGNLIAQDGVGIGTETPQSTLHIHSPSSNILRFTRNGSNIYGFEIGTTTTTFGLYNYTNATYLWKNQNGNMGIGGNGTPDEKLHVFGTSAGQGAHIGNTYIGNWDNSSAFAVFTHNSLKSSVYKYALLQHSGGETYLNAASGKNINFRIENSTKMILLSNGNVGIGTTAPRNKLDVEGGLVVGSSYSGTYSSPSNGLLVQGNVGIGTSSPSYKLEVMGTGRFSSNVYLNGNVGIRTTSPQRYLHVNTNNSGNGIMVGSNSGLHVELERNDLIFNRDGAKSYIVQAGNGQLAFVTNGNYNNTRMLIDASGRIGVNKDNPSVTLDVNGAVNCSGGTCSSDIRFKENISHLKKPLNKVLNLKGVNYYWKVIDFPERNFSEKLQVGFIAQEVEKVIPELITTMEDGYKSMDYEKLSAYLVEAIREQNQMIEILEKRIKELEKKIK